MPKIDNRILIVSKVSSLHHPLHEKTFVARAVFQHIDRFPEVVRIFVLLQHFPDYFNVGSAFRTKSFTFWGTLVYNDSRRLIFIHRFFSFGLLFIPGAQTIYWGYASFWAEHFLDRYTFLRLLFILFYLKKKIA